MKRTKASAKAGSPLVGTLPGLLVTAIAVGALLYFVDFNELSDALSKLDYGVLPLVMALFLGTLASRAMAWRTILTEQASFRDTFPALNQGYLLNNVLPFRLGELGRAFLLANRIGKNFWAVFSSIIVERIFDLGIAAGLLLVSVPLVVGADWARSAAFVAGVLVIAGFGVLFLMASKPEWVINILSGLSNPFPKVKTWVMAQAKNFLQGLSALKQITRFVRVAFWMLLTWAFNIGWYFVLMRSFFPEATWVWAVFSIGVASVGVALPSSPAYIGVLEAALVGSLSLFGADEAVALAYALVAHILYFVITGVIGIVGFLQQGQSLGQVYNQLRSRSEAK